MNKIVISGYPKSGNTWLTRLVAELINCPVKGFWNSDKEEIAKEGLSRGSSYACYKSHHQLEELRAIEEQADKIIYVIRDPRDITISGKNFFRSVKIMDPKKTRLKSLAKILNKIFYKTIGKSVMEKKMIGAVLYGDSTVHHWCRVSWKAHLMPYLEAENVCKVTYEDMLDDPMTECQKILRFLEIKKSSAEIETAIENQSFAMAKQKFKQENALNKANFLRKGGRGYWIKSFSAKEKQLFIDEVGPQLQQLGYPLKSN